MLENIGTKMWFSPKKNSYEKYMSTRPNPPRNPINLTWPASLPCLLGNIWNVEYIWYGIYTYEFRFVKILKNRYKSEKRKKINCTYYLFPKLIVHIVILQIWMKNSKFKEYIKDVHFSLFPVLSFICSRRELDSTRLL